MARNKDFRGGSGEVVTAKDAANSEPSCEELKAMWRFSKRQSRAAEITNEIPTYRDPFSYNVWEPYYPRSRSIGGMRMGRYRGRPVYGRLIHKAPMLRIHDVAERNRAFEEVARMYGTVQRNPEPRRRLTAFRLSGGGHLPTMGGLTPQSGSFQHLKELIRTERARELQEQRLAEEAAARDEALKELANSAHRSHANFRDMNYNYEEDMGLDIHDTQHDSMPGHKTVLAFPDMLSPAARMGPDEARLIEDYSYYRDRPRNQRRSSYELSSYNTHDDDTMEDMVL